MILVLRTKLKCFLYFFLIGTVYGWGMGTSRQLGTGDEEDVWEPVKMSGKQLETR